MPRAPIDPPASRTTDKFGNPINATATMPNGRALAGMAGLRALLLERPEQFAGTVTEKLLSYASGAAWSTSAGRSGGRLPLVGAHRWHRPEPGVSDAERGGEVTHADSTGAGDAHR